MLFDRVPKAYSILATAVLLVGCASQSSSPSQAPATSSAATASSSAATASSSAATGALEPETTEFLIASSGGTGITYSAIYPAIDDLNAQGWNIKLVGLGSNDLMVQAVVDGQTPFGTQSIEPSMIAAGQGAPITHLMVFANNTWTSYSVSDITSCEELDGRDYAVHSLSSLTYQFPRQWVSENCPGTEPNWLILPGSENRVAAMLADQIDATTMSVADAINFEGQAPEGKFNLLSPFYESLSDIHTGLWFGNTDFIAANPNTTTLFLAAVLKQYRLLQDPDYFKENLTKYAEQLSAEDYDEETIDRVVEIFTSNVFWPPDGGLTLDSMEATVDFWQAAEVLPADVKAEDLIDLSWLEAALQVVDDQ